MPKFRNGLAKVGRVYRYNFSQGGRTYGGSTRCEHRFAAEQFLRKFRDNLALEKLVAAKITRLRRRQMPGGAL